MRDILPKLNLACANDELRPAMNHVYINGDEVVASDAYILIVHNKKELFGPCAEAFPEECYIEANDWKELTTKFERLEVIDSSENHILKYLMVHRKKGAPRAVRLLSKTEIGNYPNYRAVIPENNDGVVAAIGIKPKLLMNCLEAMTTLKDKSLKLDFESDSRAIKLSVNYTKDEVDEGLNCKVEGIIMPVMLFNADEYTRKEE